MAFQEAFQETSQEAFLLVVGLLLVVEPAVHLEVVLLAEVIQVGHL